MPASEIAAILGQAVPTQSEQAEPSAPTSPAAASVSDAEKSAIAEAVRNEVRPLRREIAAYREHNDFQTILGGLGYIFGLFGLGFYIAARRKLAG
jgi:nickel transport protein